MGRCMQHDYTRGGVTKFLEGRGKSMGRGPSTASQAAKDKRAQCKRAKEYVQCFKENNFTIGDGEDVFIPAKQAKHKAPNNFSSSDPLQAAFPSNCPGSGNAAFPSSFPGTRDASLPSSCLGSSPPTALSVLQGNTPLPPLHHKVPMHLGLQLIPFFILITHQCYVPYRVLSQNVMGVATSLQMT